MRTPVGIVTHAVRQTDVDATRGPGVRGVRAPPHAPAWRAERMKRVPPSERPTEGAMNPRNAASKGNKTFGYRSGERV